MQNIGIVDDHEIVIDGFKRLIELDQQFVVVAEYNSYEEAIQGLLQTPVDILIVDISLPGKSGIELVLQVKETYPDILTIVVSMYDNEPYVSEALKSGASAYLSKRTASSELIKAISYIGDGKTYISRDVINNLKIGNSKEHLSKLGELTAREVEIFKLLAQSYSIKKIATVLDIQPKTVHVHKANLYKKLALKDLHELVQLAITQRILSIDDLVD